MDPLRRRRIASLTTAIGPTNGSMFVLLLVNKDHNQSAGGYVNDKELTHMIKQLREMKLWGQRWRAAQRVRRALAKKSH